MLSIGKVAVGGEDYYLATTASGRDHLEGLVEPDGRWLGAGAVSLGLAGRAETRDVRRLLRGREPSSGDPLLAGTGRRSVAAFDCTFSVPKSVSILQAFSPDEGTRNEIRLGHEAAVEATVGYLAEAAIAGRVEGVDGRRAVPGDLVAVGFLHRLSRSGDPHLHTHVLVANLVTDPLAGEARTLEATGLFLECRTAGALYETHLRHELTWRLGVEWQPLEGRCWSDLKGLDRAVLREFSQRSNAIAAVLRAEGWQGSAASRAASELTRPPKDVRRSYEQALEAAWDRLFRAGVTTTRLREICHRRLAGEVAKPVMAGAEWKDETLGHLASRSIDGGFRRGEVIRARCAGAREGRSVGDVLADTEEILHDERLLALGSRPARLWSARSSFPTGRSEPRYTTAELVAAEASIVRTAASMAEARPEAVTVVSYRSGERYAVLDALSADVARWRAEGRAVSSIAPGRLAAAAVESCIGADAVVVAGRGMDRPIAPVVPGSIVVVADAHAYGPGPLGEIVSAVARGGADVVLMSSAYAVAGRPLLSELAAFGDRRSVGREQPVTLQRVPEREVSDRVLHRFAGLDVTLVGSLSAACAEAERQLAAASSEGRRAVVVSADESVVAAVRARTGAGTDVVVHSRRLHLASSPAELARTGLVVIGGASVLRTGATAAPSVERSHILVAPGVDGRSREALGRAAEAARPRYLVGALGLPGSSARERERWRAAAVAVEGFRARWLVSDRTRAFGAEQRREHPPLRLADRAAVERQAAAGGTLGRTRSRAVDAPFLGGPGGIGR